MTASDSDIEKKARQLYHQLSAEVPRHKLWPVVVGLLQHLIIDNDATSADYHYGMFAVTDTLRDAAYRHEEMNHGMAVDIELLTMLRRLHLSTSVIVA